jgi:hypothetical protein
MLLKTQVFLNATSFRQSTWRSFPKYLNFKAHVIFKIVSKHFEIIQEKYKRI